MAIFHIVGAGVSGLTLAYELAKNGAQVRIYEKLGLPGGLARTEILNHKRIDCRPHLYHTNNRNSRLLAAAAGIKFLEPQLYGANYKSGRVYEYRYQKEAWKNNFLMKNTLRLFLN